MLGVGGAAAVADDQEPITCAQRRDDGFSDFACGSKQRRVLRRQLKGGERKPQMGADRVFRFLAQNVPSGLQVLVFGNDSAEPAQAHGQCATRAMASVSTRSAIST